MDSLPDRVINGFWRNHVLLELLEGSQAQSILVIRIKGNHDSQFTKGGKRFRQ